MTLQRVTSHIMDYDICDNFSILYHYYHIIQESPYLTLEFSHTLVVNNNCKFATVHALILILF